MNEDDFEERLYPPYQTDPEDCQRDHRRQIEDYLESICDLIAETMDPQKPVVLRALWQDVAVFLSKARIEALCLVSHTNTTMIQERSRRGMRPCSHCHAWFPEDDLVKQVVEHNTKREKRGEHSWLTCPDCMRKVR
jgi:hypothetical protein